MLRAVNLCSKNSHIFDEFCRHYWVWSHNLGGYRHRNQGLGRRVAWLPAAARPLWTLEDGAPRGLALAPSELRRDRGDGAVPGEYCPGGDHHWDYFQGLLLYYTWISNKYFHSFNPEYSNLQPGIQDFFMNETMLKWKLILTPGSVAKSWLKTE